MDMVQLLSQQKGIKKCRIPPIKSNVRVAKWKSTNKGHRDTGRHWKRAEKGLGRQPPGV
jgi:hypothetical protein